MGLAGPERAVGALVQGRAKVCKGWWAPQWLRNGEGAPKKVLEGLARDCQCRRGQGGLLCKGVQKCARTDRHQNGSEMERGLWERFWGGLHGTGGVGGGSGGSCERACKNVQGRVGTRMVQKCRGGTGKGFGRACMGLAGGGAVGALVQGRAKVCKTKWAPEWLRDRVGH